MEQPQRQQLLQLIDEDEWFNIYGLPANANANANTNATASGRCYGANDSSEAIRVAREDDYQKKISAKIFAEDDKKKNKESNTLRLEQLERWKRDTIDIYCTTAIVDNEQDRDDEHDDHEHDDEHEHEHEHKHKHDNEVVVIRINLEQLAARSDTVYTMASNQHLFQTRYSNHNYNHHNNHMDGNRRLDNNILPSEKDANACSNAESISTETTTTLSETELVDTTTTIKTTTTTTTTATATSPNNLSLSLKDYSTESVKIFLKVLLSSPLPSPADPLPATSVAAPSIPPEYVIDCCRLAHYLQCCQQLKLLDSIVDDYLLAPGSIDDENCLYLCQLADELSLPRLWEAAVNHVLSSLDKFQGTSTERDDNNNNNKNEIESCLWDDLSPALKTEIQALRGILRSSNRKQVYFSTYHEYLGLLAEQHQYYKERLEDAKHGLRLGLDDEARLREELEALLAERALNEQRHTTNTNTYHRARLDRRIQTTTNRLEGLSRGRDYAGTKIKTQQRRVNALGALWKEQKKVFGGGIGGG